MTGLGQQSSAPSPLTLDPSPGLWSKRVLIIGPSNIGDAILASDVIAAVRVRFPEAHVALVVGERATALFVEDPRIQTLVDADRFDSPLGRLKLAWSLWRYRPHVIVDLRHTLYPLLLKPWAAWRYLLRPPPRLAHMRERHLWKFHAQVPVLKERSGPRAQGAGQVPGTPSPEPRAMDVRSSDAIPLWFSAKDLAHIEGLWKRWGLAPPPVSVPPMAGPSPASIFPPAPPSAGQTGGGERLVVISPGARSHIKRWMAEGFARVADRLIAERDAEIVFSGEPDEGPIVNEILGVMEHRAHSAVGLTTVRQLGILMTRARLVITNDSASLHLASALGVPTVAIFGPTDAAKYGPTSPQSRVVRRRLFCAPCEQALCRFSHECMRFINADEVYEAACALLELEVGSKK